MAIIRSSNSSAELVIDDISKAARCTFYHANGAAISETAPLPIDVTVPISIAPGDVEIGTVDQGEPATPNNAWPMIPYGIEGYPLSISITGAVKVDGSANTQPISALVLPLPNNAASEATLAAIKVKTDNLDVLLSTRTKPADIQSVVGSVAVSNFPETQPVSATSLPLPTGAATEATQLAVKNAVEALSGTATVLAVTVVVTALGDTTLVAAPGANLSIALKLLSISTASGTSHNPSLREGIGGTVRKKWIPPSAYLICETSGWVLPANTALVANLLLAVSGGVQFNLEYQIVPNVSQ